MFDIICVGFFYTIITFDVFLLDSSLLFHFCPKFSQYFLHLERSGIFFAAMTAGMFGSTDISHWGQCRVSTLTAWQVKRENSRV